MLDKFFGRISTEGFLVKQISIALMMPGAPSLTTGSGSPRPWARMPWKNALTGTGS